MVSVGSRKIESCTARFLDAIRTTGRVEAVPGSFRERDIQPFPGGMKPPSWPDVPAALYDWIATLDRVADNVSPIEAIAAAHGQFDNLYRFVVPAVAGPNRLVPLAALTSTAITEGSLRVAANRRRLNANKGPTDSDAAPERGSTSTSTRGIAVNVDCDDRPEVVAERAANDRSRSSYTTAELPLMAKSRSAVTLIGCIGGRSAFAFDADTSHRPGAAPLPSGGRKCRGRVDEHRRRSGA